MSDLLNSRWAPGASGAGLRYPRSENRMTNTSRFTGSNSSPRPGALLSPAEELSRFMKISARLHWKLPFLASGYRLAIQELETMSKSTETSQAEIMFKLDFYEYYALLERAIVHLLAVFNISVAGSGSGSRAGQAGMHRYHANVLQALQEETTPLTPVLGSGYVHELLRKAKELRNRWKAADMTKEEREKDPFEAGRNVLQLVGFDFDEIFQGIFRGLEEGFVRAKAHVDLCRRPGDVEGEDAGWGFMVDAMDWEAV